AEKDADKQAAYDTLYTVLVTMTRALAPFLPFLTEHIHRALVDGESVHLANWPDASALVDDKALVERMDLARTVASAALSTRTANNMRTRLPLRSLTIAHPGFEKLALLKDVIADEVNVKEVVLAADPSAFGEVVLAVDPKIGKRLGKNLKDVLNAARAGQWEDLGGGRYAVAGQTIEPGEYELRFKANEGLDAVAFDGAAGVVVLDTHVDEALEREGVARDFIRLVQTARKEAGFNIADRIHIEVKIANGLGGALVDHAETIRAETLAETLRPTNDRPEGFVSETSLLDEPIEIGVRVAR
ncbi:MAG: class I tRNA ligase family protein, partial [Rhizobiales bacterium]|nr:class I tRNA ligase family protein [Hyphomicrobiales bacterium]